MQSAMQSARDAPLTVIGLGSNLGDRRAMLEAAFGAIEAIADVHSVGRSSIWQTLAVGGTGSDPDYYNAAVAVRTTVAPEQLLATLLAIEATLGRVRLARNAPRTIDLDILWMQSGALQRNVPGWPPVEVPHPRLAQRAFAMIPLLELVPDAADPVSGRLYAEILVEVGTEGVEPAAF
jgi:2-amino-4-hydroxy-6-hydroxymethyldihydropteridine diphosphokinase